MVGPKVLMRRALALAARTDDFIGLGRCLAALQDLDSALLRRFSENPG